MVTQRNIALNQDIFIWAQANHNDQRRGILAGVQQPQTIYHQHDIMLTLDTGQLITKLMPSVWVWQSTDLLSGEYAVGATTFIYNQEHHYASDERAYLGLVPLARLLDRRVAHPITV